jgi:serine phosphatase RsbU (regulator of sigma subunit)
VVALMVGLLVTGGLVAAAQILYERNEIRLLRLRGHELGLVLGGLVPSIQTPLASAAELADVTRGNVSRFDSLVAAEVGSKRQFVSVSLWRLRPARMRPAAVLGLSPGLASHPRQAAIFFKEAVRHPVLHVSGVGIGGSSPRIGYEYATPGVRHGFAVYAESALPKSRRLTLPSGSGLEGLNYALYLGRRQRHTALLVSNLTHLPVSGSEFSEIVPFGSDALTLVVTPNGPLSGTFFRDLPWIFGVGGVLLAIAAALVTDRLARRRRHAEALAEDLDRVARENRDKYAEQRGISETLQHALLPEALPMIDGLITGARYVPAAVGIEVGGDWYDLVAVDGKRALLVIGDVSGHGLSAATTMAAMRHAALAYAAEDPEPGSLLERMCDFVNGTEHTYFATVLCALIDVDTHTATLASAGHPAPLLIADGTARFAKIDVGVPIGVPSVRPRYRTTHEQVDEGATLLAFTDGLIERRGEILDVGMARLRKAALEANTTLDGLMSRLAEDLASDDNDDTAILGVQWTT